jgi:hypothetical protein
MVNVIAPPLTGTQFEHTIIKWVGFSYFVTTAVEPGPLCVFKLFSSECWSAYVNYVSILTWLT